MSTRSLTVVKRRWKNEEQYRTLVTIYRHGDGYPRGQGVLLVEFLDLLKDGAELVCEVDSAGRLAATLITYMQMAGHNPELMFENPSATQEYVYVILLDCECGEFSITMKVYDRDRRADSHMSTVMMLDYLNRHADSHSLECSHLASGDVEAFKVWVSAHS